MMPRRPRQGVIAAGWARAALCLTCLALLMGLPPGGGRRASAQAPAASTVFEGARLILGDGRAPIENGVLVVAGGRIAQAGARGTVTAPAGAARVDLAGKTIMPALVDAHVHIGYMRHLTSGPQNYTRENIYDHLHRFAYHGVAAAIAMGSDFGDLPFQIRDETARGADPEAARFLSAGRGLAPPDEIRPDNMRHSAYRIESVDDVRRAVGELAARGVAIVKTWVDDRGGAVRPLTPALYTAIITEAHARGMRVMVHATGLNEAKALVRANVDILGHMVEDVDDDLVALLKARPNVAVLLALGGPRRLVAAPWIDPPHPLILETVRPEQVARLRGRLASTTPAARAAATAAWEKMARGIARLNAAGVTIGLGTDGGGQTGDQFVGWTVHTELENMVAGGLTPAQALVAGTRTSARVLGLTDLGTLEAGKSADFVVLDANPLDDITNSRRIARVYLRGHEVDRAALRAGWTAASR